MLDIQTVFLQSAYRAKNNLTPKQKSALESRHKKTRDVRECRWIKAVLLSSEDWSRPCIAQAKKKSDFTIICYLDEYLKKEKLKPDHGGSESLLIEHLEQQTYAHVHQIVAYIFER